MDVIKIIEKCAEKNIELWVSDGKLHYKNPYGAFDNTLKKEVKENREAIIEYLDNNSLGKIQSDETNKYVPFPVTDIQAAYLLGRSLGYVYGGIGCKIYAEFLMNFTDENKFRLAVRQLVNRQEMLKTHFMNEGQQMITYDLENLPIEIYHCENAPKQKIKEYVLDKREELQFKQYNPEKDTLFDIALFITENGSILCLSLDMLIGDFISIELIISDLEKLYNEEEILPLEINFRDYIIYTQRQKKTIQYLNKYYEDKNYWKNKIYSLPGKPEIYTDENPKLIESGKFFHKEFFLNNKEWIKLEEKCRKYNVTPTVMVLLLYCITIKQWSKSKSFLINITSMQRPDIHRDLQNIVGDFTTTTLFEFIENGSYNFKTQARHTQKILFDNLAHNAFNGIEVLRELRKIDKDSIIPYVFTSTIGIENENKIINNRKLLYKISETPQVLIDCQLTKIQDGVLINWDIRDGVFPRNLIDEMFHYFVKCIYKAQHENFWENKPTFELSNSVQRKRKEINNTLVPYKNMNLIESFFVRYKTSPNKIILICGEDKYSYSELMRYVSMVQNSLLERGVKNQNKIGVLLNKGVWQIASVIAILSLGAVYVPIDASQPNQRIQQIVDQAKIKCNIYDEKDNKITDNDIFVNSDNIFCKENAVYQKIDPDATAYCIFTSGSTGIPKGVEMSHASAMNTIMDICKKFKVSENDSILGISNLCFDLSVFDIFASFYANATLILPLEGKKHEVSYWKELCEKYHVTIYNMVPAQIEMFMAYLQIDETSCLNPRLILLSGDWISSNLVRRIHKKFSETQCIGLGGATECGIWSIYYPTDKLQKQDRNVPYGIPLANQRFYILDENNVPCPDYVIGEICIAGKSLAKGYLNDMQLTNDKFQYIDYLNERIYKTGDIGFYRKDGVIEFMGRKDMQVKVNGYRVELGEIENALKGYKQVNNAVVIRNIEGKLVAYVTKSIGMDKKTTVTRKRVQEAEFGFTFSRKDFQKWIDAADKTALMYILALLKREGIFQHINEKYSINDIIKHLGVRPQYCKLVTRWLTALKEKEYINESSGMFYVTKNYADDIAEQAEEEWKLLDRKIGYSDILMQYIHTSSVQLKKILTGKVHPNEILFPQGKLDIAFAAYKDNIVNYSINSILHKEVLEIVANRRSNIRILEIGAGVAGSSLGLIEKLHPYNVEYYFTDISQFFFNEAKRIFSQYDWIQYKIYDINLSNWEQGFEGEYFDIIICGNVLHNAQDIKKSLINIKKMIRNNGKLFIIEEVKKRYALMTSMEFEFAEAATDYIDGRKIEESIFVDYKGWKKIIEDMNGYISLTYPDKQDILYPSGQILMEIDFKQNNDLNISRVGSYLKTKLPEYMIPSKIVQLNEFPITSNGKIDRNKLSKRKEENNKGRIIKEENLNDLEKRIRDIWCEVIGSNEIEKDEDFYSAGGDSLLIAQTVSLMIQKLPEAKAWEWDSLMMEMMKNATIEGIAGILREKTITKTVRKTEIKTESISPFISFKDPEGKCKTARILFHAGTGTLSSYKELLPYLVDLSKAEDLLAGFNFGSFEEYLGRNVDTLITDTARVYADILEKISAEQYIMIGYCVGGWIAFEAAKILIERGKNVSKVITISSSLCGHNYDNEILLERAFGLSIGADINKAGYIGSDALLQNALEDFREKNGDRAISTGELCALDGEYQLLGLEFERLNKMPQEERLKNILKTVSENDSENIGNISMFKTLYQLFKHSFEGIMRYEPSMYVGDVHTLFVADDTKHFFPVRNISNKELWESIVLGNLVIDYIPGEHVNCLKEPNAKILAKLLE